MPGFLREQIDTVFRRDPAARSVLEIVLCYPGFHAWFCIVSRTGSTNAAGSRSARRDLAIFPGDDRYRNSPRRDHRPALLHRSRNGRRDRRNQEIGDDVLMYQGVTLGGTGKDTGKRHPTIGNGVVIGTGAKILGNIRIGDYVKVGAGSVVVRPVPDHSTVVGVPGRIVGEGGFGVTGEAGYETGGGYDVEALEHGHLPDPEGQAIDELSQRVAELEAMIRTLVDEKISSKR